MKKIYLILALLLACGSNFNDGNINSNRSIKKQNPIISEIYSTYLNKPSISTLGQAYLYKDDKAGTVKKVVRAGFWTWDKSKEDFPKYAYAVYKFEKNINACVKELSKVKEFVRTEEKITFTTTLTTSDSFEYQTSVGVSASSKLSCTDSIEAGINFNDKNLKKNVSCTAEVETCLSSYITVSQKYTVSNTETLTREFVSTDSAYYSYQMRASFIVFNIHVYEIDYSDKTTNVKWCNGYRNAYYTYYPKYKLIENNIRYDYIDGSLSRGFYKYKMDRYGSLVYSDITSSNVVCIS